MKIEFERSGGFMGALITDTIDTAELPHDDARIILEMVQESQFFELPGRLEADNPGMDQFQYKLTIAHADGQPYTVEMGDTAVPQAMQPLLRKLTLLARNQLRSQHTEQNSPDQDS